MRTRCLVVVLALVSCAIVAAQKAPKVKYPGKSGVFAMTPQGAVELKVSGEPNEVPGAIGIQNFFSAEDFDKIPKVESVNSFYVSAMGWAVRRVYLVVGRDGLVNSLDRYQMFSTSIVSRGVVAFEVVSPDLQDPGYIVRSARKLAKPGTPVQDIEAYLVLELKGTTGLSPRNYPVRVMMPAQ